MVDTNRYRPFPIIEAQVRPVGGVWLIEESNNDQLKHCWFDDTRINVPLFIKFYLKLFIYVLSTWRLIHNVQGNAYVFIIIDKL